MFQFTLPRGERLAGSMLQRRVYICFNSRSREGSDCILIRWRFSYQKFQFTLPRGERQRVVESPLRFTIRFNSRSREGSDVVQADTLKEAVAFQFTLPRGERPGRFAFLASANVVSIHAPARGATYRDYRHLLDVKFQFTLPRGERPYGDLLIPVLGVSIHAPARGATGA